VNHPFLADNETPTNTVEALRHSILERLVSSRVKDVDTATPRD
jgi:hypothetical protein